MAEQGGGGFVVDTSEFGEDGIEVGKLYDYDIILLDLNLPDMNGEKVLERLRANPATSGIPVIAVTGEAMFEREKGLRALGVTEADVLASINDGSLKAKKIGSAFRITRTALDEFLKS